MIFPVVFQDQKGPRQSVFLLDLIYFHPDGKKFLGFQCSEIPMCPLHVPFNSRVLIFFEWLWNLYSLCPYSPHIIYV